MTVECIDTEKYKRHMKTCKRCNPDSWLTFIGYVIAGSIMFGLGLVPLNNYTPHERKW